MSGTYTGIEPPTKPGEEQRLSICEVFSREELQPSRQDIEPTKDRLTLLVLKYDQNCPRSDAEAL